MSVSLDRGLQGRLLSELAAVYPDRVNVDKLLLDSDLHHLWINLYYLCEHGLAIAKWHRPLSGPPSPGDAGITARGMDFLADDGGLSAILGVVTVKLHEESLKALLIEKIEASSEPQTMKEQLKSKVKAMSGEALDRAVSELIKEAVVRIPDLAPWLTRVIGGA